MERGLSFSRAYTVEGISPLESVNYKTVDVEITGKEGVKFAQKGVEVPESWQMAASETASEKYFRRAGVTGGDKGEHSVKQLIGRVSRGITQYGLSGQYFASEKDAEIFRDELEDILVNQRAAFNSPVWFNVGLTEYGIKGSKGRGFFYDPKDKQVKPTFDSYTHPQASACFIQSIEDTLFSENEGENGIYDLLLSETRLFELGSGTGTNFSNIRGEGESLSSGGESSGLMSFLKPFDSNAGTIKSGGKTRRAAKMIILDVNHPEIMNFINLKAREEDKARVLLDAGYGEPGDLESEAYGTITGQNANNSVRVNDEFMEAVINDENWNTIERTTGEVRDTYKAREVWDAITKAAHQCADPGLQFDTMINDWHTCKNTDKIKASNPCSEFMFLDDSACNLASLNLMKYRQEDGSLDLEKFKHDIDIVLTGQEILVGQSSFPTASIAQNSNDFRPLGLGYANLGALLMANGLPYDSDEGRALAAGITSLMTARAYHHSAKMAGEVGTFEKFEENKEPFMQVMKNHQAATTKIDNIDGVVGLEDLLLAGTEEWENANEVGSENGFRNAQVSVLAPTGTIGFFMDCDTTGIEPDYGLIKYKKMIGGGIREIINQQVPVALNTLNYEEGKIKEIKDYITKNEGNVEGAPHLKKEHQSVFDTANKQGTGTRAISPMGHIKMMASVQPFLSGAISKTVNLPNETTIEQISEAYMNAWKLGLKSIAIYRDGSKVAQPLNNVGSEEDGLEQKLKWGERRMMPVEREGISTKIKIGGQGLYVQTGEFPDGEFGEISMSMAKEGSEFNTVMTMLSKFISKSRQYGMPIDEIVNTLRHVKSEKGGMTNHPNISMTISPYDFTARWLDMHYNGNISESNVHNPPEENSLRVKVNKIRRASGNGKKTQTKKEEKPKKEEGKISTGTGEFCSCGSEMVRAGSCFRCLNCHDAGGCG